MTDRPTVKVNHILYAQNNTKNFFETDIPKFFENRTKNTRDIVMCTNVCTLTGYQKRTEVLPAAHCSLNYNVCRLSRELGWPHPNSRSPGRQPFSKYTYAVIVPI